MDISDLQPHDAAAIEQAAQALVDGFREHWPAAWSDLVAARAEVEAALEPGKVCRVARDADADRAGKALLTFMVDDLDRHIAELMERGIAVGAIDTQPGRYRKAAVTDPEGNMISFGQALSPSND